MVTYWPTGQAVGRRVVTVTVLTASLVPLIDGGAACRTASGSPPLNETVGVAAPSALTGMFWNAIEMALRLVPVTTGCRRPDALGRPLRPGLDVADERGDRRAPGDGAGWSPLSVSVKVPPVMQPSGRS